MAIDIKAYRRNATSHRMAIEQKRQEFVLTTYPVQNVEEHSHSASRTLGSNFSMRFYNDYRPLIEDNASQASRALINMSMQYYHDYRFELEDNASKAARLPISMSMQHYNDYKFDFADNSSSAARDIVRAELNWLLVLASAEDEVTTASRTLTSLRMEYENEN